MIDWDYWREGVFEFVKTEKGRRGKVTALLWQWDEYEAQTKFESV
jgi:hypothetical protein